MNWKQMRFFALATLGLSAWCALLMWLVLNGHITPAG